MENHIISHVVNFFQLSVVPTQFSFVHLQYVQNLSISFVVNRDRDHRVNLWVRAGGGLFAAASDIPAKQVPSVWNYDRDGDQQAEEHGHHETP